MAKNKTSMAITMVLISAMALTLMALPSASAHTPTWTIISYAYLVPAPNPVGVGQTIAIVMWIDDPLPGATVTNAIRRHDYTLTITKPSGGVDTQHWDVVSDSTSVQYYQYVPTEVGNYTIKFDYPAQTYTWSGAYQNDTFTAASKTVTLVVQEEQIPLPRTSYPMPTEYWVRPIEGQNTYWYSISSNWLGTPYILGAGASFGLPGAVQPDGTAPNSAHVMWTKPIQFGGVVGGNDTAIPGEMYYAGLSYATRFSNPLIMNGILYYQEPYGNSGSGGDYVAVDLPTGKEVWRINATGGAPAFGYQYTLESPNQHGVVPNGLLFTSNFARAYDPGTGVLTTMNITNVPSGTAVAGPRGEMLRYSLTNRGTSTDPNWYLAQWNSSKVFDSQNSGTINASTTARYDWNISLPTLKGTGWAVGVASLSNAVPLVNLDDKLLLVQGTFGGHPGDYGGTVSLDPANITAISLKANSLGQVLWSKSYDPAPRNNSRIICDWDPVNGVFVFIDKEDLVHYGYSLTDGNKIWGPTKLTNDYTTDYQYMTLGLERIAYGNLYFTGYSGILYCYDVKAGDLKWTYGNGGEGNSTSSGFVTPYGRYPIFLSTIADGKVYVSTTEHSPNEPLYKDARYRCINATDGTEIWTILGYGHAMYGGQAPVADGYLTMLNSYDSRIYCFGKGPSATTVEAPITAVTLGSSIVIRGTVTDIAAGTTQNEQAARFPNGVPAVSDDSMGRWMEYVYMQKPRPTDVTGVEVTISVLDSNNNYREIGTTTGNSDGFFTLNWEPDIEGQYTVYASFGGSESYWPSHAVTSFAVDPAIQTESPEYPQPIDPTMTILGVGVAILIAIAILGAIVVLMLRKKQ
jgi:outer membrane protein assembly factor BamB